VLELLHDLRQFETAALFLEACKLHGFFLNPERESESMDEIPLKVSKAKKTKKRSDYKSKPNKKNVF
jgi:hypothetical protein